MTPPNATASLAERIAHVVKFHIRVNRCGYAEVKTDDAVIAIRDAIAASPELASVRAALEGIDTIEEHSGKSTHREWANNASTWLYPGDAWGIFDGEKIKQALAALNALTVEAKCDHRWRWKLRDGTPWAKPALANYDPTLVIGTCTRCGEIHQPTPEAGHPTGAKAP